MVDEEIVVDKLRHINEYTNDLKEMRGMTKEDYITDTVLQRARVDPHESHSIVC